MKKTTRRKKKRYKTWETAIILLLGLGLLIFSLTGGNKALLPYKYDSLVQKYSEQRSLDKALVAALINQESGYRPDIKSNKGAMGLMQIMPETAKWISGQLEEDYDSMDFTDPETNIRYGTWYLKYLMDKYTVTENALAAYNAGSGNVDEWLDDPSVTENGKLTNIPFEETKNYVRSIMRMKEVYRKMYAQDFRQNE